MEGFNFTKECIICREEGYLVKMHDEHFCCYECYTDIGICPLCRINITEEYKKEECIICYEERDLVPMHDDHYCCSECYKKIDVCPLCRITFNEPLSKDYVLEYDSDISDIIEEEEEFHINIWNEQHRISIWNQYLPRMHTSLYVPRLYDEDFDEILNKEAIDDGCLYTIKLGVIYWYVLNDNPNVHYITQKWHIRCFADNIKVRKYNTMEESLLAQPNLHP